MRIRLSNPSRLRDLIDYLQRGEYVAVEAAGKTVEAHLPRVADERRARNELRLYLATWMAMNPGVTAEIVEPG